MAGAAIFPPENKGGVPPGPNVCNGYTPMHSVIGEGPLYISPDCTTILTDCQMNSLASEILAAVDELGFAFNSSRVNNLGEALIARFAVQQADIETRVSRTGDTMTGPLVLHGPPANDNDAATKAYVDEQASAHAADLLQRIEQVADDAQACCDSKVSKAGDVMTGPLQLWGDPQSLGEAVNKQYVDDLVAAHAWQEAPNDGRLYGRRHLGWEPVPTETGGGPIGGGADVVAAPDPPTNPRPNTLWWDSSGGGLFIFFDDADSSQWVEVSSGTSGGLLARISMLEAKLAAMEAP
jgi:hypothetical protein